MTKDSANNPNLIHKEFVDRHQSALLAEEHIIALPVSAQHEEQGALASRLNTEFASLSDEQRSAVQTTALRYASSFASNLETYNLRLEAESADRLVLALTDMLLANRCDENALQTTLDELGLSTLLARMYPDIEAQPMFPDFPRQVVEMSELEYRIHQTLHYASTYGVEDMYACILDTSLTDVSQSPLHVKKGYRPQVEATERTRDDEAAHGMVELQTVRLITSLEEVAGSLSAALARPVRMSRGLLNVASWLYARRAGEAMQGCGIQVPGGVAFKENGTEIVCAVACSPESSAHSIKLACEELLPNPMDVLKCFRILVDARINNARNESIDEGSIDGNLIGDNTADEWQQNARVLINGLGDELGKVSAGSNMHPVESGDAKHISTRVKRGFAQVLLAYPIESVVQNIADAHPSVRNGVKYLSLKRFAASDAYERIMAAVNGKVPSWNSRAEQLWARAAQANQKLAACSLCNEQGEDGSRDASISPEKAFIEQDDTMPSKAIASAQHERAQAMSELLAHYAQRPGMLLRVLTRLVRVGMTQKDAQAADVAGVIAHSVSLASLLKFATQCSVSRMGAMAVGESGHVVLNRGKFAREEDDERKLREYRTVLDTVVLPALRQMLARIAATDGRLGAFAGKKVFVDAGGFSLEGSLAVPNDSGRKTAWPPAGMAFALPQVNHLRFFTYWDDRRKRVTWTFMQSPAMHRANLRGMLAGTPDTVPLV